MFYFLKKKQSFIFQFIKIFKTVIKNRLEHKINQKSKT